MRDSSLLIRENDKANMDILLTMLGPVDREIICTRYGLFGLPMKPLGALAEHYRVKPEVIEDIIEKDFRKLAVTPEWQAMVQMFSPMVRQRIGLSVQR